MFADNGLDAGDPGNVSGCWSCLVASLVLFLIRLKGGLFVFERLGRFLGTGRAGPDDEAKLLAGELRCLVDDDGITEVVDDLVG